MILVLILASSLQMGGHSQFDVQANTFTNNRQTEASIATDSQGNVLAVWGSRRQELGSFGVFAQFLDPLGRPLTTEIHVNQYLPREQAKPSVFIDANDVAWIFWRSMGQDGAGTEVYGRRFSVRNRTFTAQSDEFRVNQDIVGDQRDGVCCALPNGNVLTSWISEKNGVSAVFGRIFGADGQPLSDDLVLHADPQRSLSMVSLASHPQGVLASWARANLNGSPDGIQGGLISFGADNNKSMKLFDAHNGESSLAFEPCIDSASEGSFIVSWMSTADGIHFDATARRFNSDLSPAADEFIVSARANDTHSGAQVAVADNGDFIVAYTKHHAKLWRGPGHRPDEPASVFAQKYAANGDLMGELMRLNSFDDGEQSLQVGHNGKHLLWSSQGQIIAAWHGNTGTDHRAVGLSFLVPNDLQPTLPPTIAPLAAASELALEDVYGTEAKPVYDPNFVAPAPTTPPLALGGIDGFQAFSSTGWTPPDPDLAVGPSHIVAVVNGGIRIFDKGGNQSYSTSLVSFWSSVGAGGFVFDPVALFDPHTQRYVIAAADGAGTNDAICLAVSDDNDPNGTWHKYRFPVSSTCVYLDFPNLGINKDALFMPGDCFSGGGNRIFMWDIDKLINGLPVTMNEKQTSGSPQSLGASKNYDSASDAGYFATTYAGSSTQIMLRAITDPNGSPILHSNYLSVPSYSSPPNAAQMGTSNQASTIDYRIKNSVVRNGKMWVCHNTASNSACQLRWYEIDLNGWPTSGTAPSLVQSGTLDYGSGDSTWFGDINVADDGTVAIAFSRSSASQYISIETAMRYASDATGTFRAPETLQASTSPETGSRWGDYSGLEEDPVVPGKFWSHNEFRTTGWNTWVGEFSLGQELLLSTSSISAGGSSTLTALQGNVGEKIRFLVSLNPGNYAPPQLGGIALNLGQPITYLGAGTVNAFGIATLNLTVPANAPVGANVYLQAAAIRGVNAYDSVKSNLVSDVIN